MFAMEGIGAVMPVENEMENPKYFLGCPGVLNFVMTTVILLYATMGFFGYARYGDSVNGNIVINLPQELMYVAFFFLNIFIFKSKFFFF